MELSSWDYDSVDHLICRPFEQPLTLDQSLKDEQIYPYDEMRRLCHKGQI